MALQFYNTLSRKKEIFTPENPLRVRMYVCGPTVYDRPHLGNARSVVVYDVLFRLLRHIYGDAHVVYARNITDVDDKINARAKERGIPIQTLTQEVAEQFHADMNALNCLSPTEEPRATRYIAEMHALIEKLLAGGHAYVAEGHVLFDITSDAEYGRLSGRKREEQVAGARVDVEPYKKHPGDFVLWKPAEPGDDSSSVFESPWGPGRPGWHIECSAMSGALLGPTFDLHGGGADLMFPHHENEIAQSRCANKNAAFARHWVHNGFLTVDGEKMSKSLGNFITVHDLLEKGVKGEDIRLALLSAKYNEPLDWNAKLIADAGKTLDRWYRNIATVMPQFVPDPRQGKAFHAFMGALNDDMNTPAAFSIMHGAAPEELYVMGKTLGFFSQTPDQRFRSGGEDEAAIAEKIALRAAAKKAKNWAEADHIRKELAEKGIVLEDRPDGSTDWRRGNAT